MAATGQADWVAMTRLADEVAPGGHAAEISNLLQRLETSLETLAPQWQSEAASAFYSVNAHWQEKANAVNTALMDIADGLRETARRYQVMTQTSADNIQSTGRF